MHARHVPSCPLTRHADRYARSPPRNTPSRPSTTTARSAQTPTGRLCHKTSSTASASPSPARHLQPLRVVKAFPSLSGYTVAARLDAAPPGCTTAARSSSGAFSLTSPSCSSRSSMCAFRDLCIMISLHLQLPHWCLRLHRLTHPRRGQFWPARPAHRAPLAPPEHLCVWR
jgi:hypothetical protein